jgi:membrane-bound ClpP family serine protease
MGSTEPLYSAQPQPASPSRPHNGLGVAALVIGVASLVAGLSFLLFPLALLGGLVGLIIGIIALAGGRARGATNAGQATAGLICSILALIIAVDLSVHVGTWAARNTSVFTQFDKCIAQAKDRPAVATCISNFANDVRR